MENEYIEESQETLRRQTRGIKIAREFLRFAIAEETPLYISAQSSSIRITVSDVEGLKAARQLYRKYLGSWKDHATDISVSGTGDDSFAWITYRRDDKDKRFEIHFDCTVATIPKDLQKPGCGVKEFTYTSAEFVCDV